MARRRPAAAFLVIFALLILSIGAPVSSFAQSETQNPAEPQITAVAAIVVEYPSGRIIYQKAAHDRMPPASLTKILTAILAIEYGKLDDVITVVPEDLAGESTMGLVAGEQQTLHNLLYGMMLPSGNDAATTIARYLGSQESADKQPGADPVAHFSEMMNARLAQLGLTDSHFVTPHGLDTPDHYSTAYDLASFTWYALHIKTFNEIVSTVAYDAPGHSLLNTNEMLTRYPGADGVKTGWTDGCGLCLVTSATRDGHRLISVVLNAPRWYSDSTALLDYGFSVLAATPVDPNAEVLSISKRDTVAWLLANPEVVPPVIAAPVVATPALAQGGGAAPEAAAKPALAPAESAATNASSPATGTQTAQLAATGNSDSGLVLSIAIFGLIAIMSCFALMRLRRSHAPVAFAGATRFMPLRIRRRAPHSLDGESVEPVNQDSQSRNWTNKANAPGNTRILPSASPRRRDPNLLFDVEDRQQYHIERAIELSEEGKQGSGMSEFVMALKSGPNIDIAQLAEQYRLSSGAFLALARAQVALGRPTDARRTLLHGVLVMPGERVLRLALYQLPSEN